MDVGAEPPGKGLRRVSVGRYRFMSRAYSNTPVEMMDFTHYKKRSQRRGAFSSFYYFSGATELAPLAAITTSKISSK
jgi:hypothetical protein